MSNSNKHDETKSDSPTARAERSFRSALSNLRQVASEATEEAIKLAKSARPEVERRAKQAKAAADSTRPHIEKKAREATDYVREHQDEIIRASKRGASVAASGAARAATPRPLRPAVDAMQRELRKIPADEATTTEDSYSDATDDRTKP